jgi:hypothetical protein
MIAGISTVLLHACSISNLYVSIPSVCREPFLNRRAGCYRRSDAKVVARGKRYTRA